MTKIDIFSGFLGAGKTTLIKKLIKEAFAGQQVVLIENEFGEIGIDGGFLKESGIQINELNAGCICCSLVGDFRTALQQVVEQYHPDRIVIEPSGVGKLSDVTRAVEGVAEHLDVQLNSFVTVADVNKVKMYMKNFGEFYDDQISHASCILLSRTQTASEEKIAAAVAMLREKNPTATIVTTAWDELTGEQILKAMSTKDDFKAELIAMAAKANEKHAEEDEEEEHHHHHHHDDENGVCSCGHHHHDDDDDEDEHEHHHHDHDEDDDHDEHEHHHDHDEDHDHEEHCCCGHHHHDDDDDEDEHEHHHEHGEDCTCGRKGCWEAYASATALIRQGKRAAAAQPESLLAGYGEGLTGKDVFDAAAAGDAAAQAVVDRYCVYVAAGITDLVNILGPEMVLIGGGISRQGERLLAPIRAYVAANCFGGHDRTPPVIECARLGNEAGIIGAAAL